MESFLHTLENTLQILFLCPTHIKQKFHWNLLKRLLTVDQHLPSSTNIYLPYQFEQPHMYCFESRLEVSDEETPHALGSEDGFQYIQHEVPNYNKSRCQIKLYLIRGAWAITLTTTLLYIMLQVKIKFRLKFLT